MGLLRKFNPLALGNHLVPRTAVWISYSAGSITATLRRCTTLRTRSNATRNGTVTRQAAKRTPKVIRFQTVGLRRNLPPKCVF
jgi:hypothetical protein